MAGLRPDRRGRAVYGFDRDAKPQEVVQRLQAVGVASGMVQNARDLARDPQRHPRQHYVTLQHPEMDDSVVHQFGFRLSKIPGGPTHAAPVMGQHNAYVFGKLLNMGAAKIAKLQEEGVMA
jgi:crotonobetainyl-CoA:carnitine CoA-transferase CaiB-like acyl-CoA transferase